jgi:dTDP-4-amino-4,6-dideoxygalactose transaminase
MKVPFLDLVTPHEELEQELTSVFQHAIRSAGFIGGPMVEQFEANFARFCDTEYCVGVASGTDALRFALMGVGVKPGDTVVTVPNTFIATTEAISQAGAHPDFVDIDERTYNLDAAKLNDYLENACSFDRTTGRPVSKRTGSAVTAVVPVHLYGQMADMDGILDLARRYRLMVVEDACQAHGAEIFSRAESRWRRAGSISRAAAFSFYPGKNLGACGEAGGITTSDAAVAQRCRMLRDHGQSKKYFHDIEGYNGRLDAIQAGLLDIKLRQLATWNEQRRKAARRYDALFADAGRLIETPYVPEWSRPVYHLYVVRTPNRDALQKELTGAGIGTGIHYPIPLHVSKAYAAMGFRLGDFPVAERIAAEALSLPMFPGLTSMQQEYVASAVLRALGHENLRPLETVRAAESSESRLA